jgi:hypothetical protein
VKPWGEKINNTVFGFLFPVKIICWEFTRTAAAYNLVRIRNLTAVVSP